jgi:hypothetical protein
MNFFIQSTAKANTKTAKPSLNLFAKPNQQKSSKNLLQKSKSQIRLVLKCSLVRKGSARIPAGEEEGLMTFRNKNVLVAMVSGPSSSI